MPSRAEAPKADNQPEPFQKMPGLSLGETRYFLAPDGGRHRPSTCSLIVNDWQPIIVVCMYPSKRTQEQAMDALMSLKNAIEMDQEAIMKAGDGDPLSVIADEASQVVDHASAGDEGWSFFMIPVGPEIPHEENPQPKLVVPSRGNGPGGLIVP